MSPSPPLHPDGYDLVDYDDVVCETVLGLGAFGEVFAGRLRSSGARVVAKRARRGVPGAPDSLAAELALNVRARRASSSAASGAPTPCAAFLGAARGRQDGQLLLLWTYQGRATLSSFLRGRGFPASLAAALNLPSSGADQALPVARAVMRQLLSALAALHAAGIVHRDVKPLNLILDEQARSFFLCDLGAAACLRTGLNFVPDESILDPRYGPPEKFLMPLSCSPPDLASASPPVAAALGAAAWIRFGPDRFDTWSAGVVLLQARGGASRPAREWPPSNLTRKAPPSPSAPRAH